MRRIVIVFILSLIVTMACNAGETIVEATSSSSSPSPTWPRPTFTQQPSPTPRPNSSSRPSSTDALQPTSAPRLTSTPLPPQAWIWSTSLSELYTHIYELGYSAEMYHHEDGYWLIYFLDLTSYFEAEGWYWYGNEIIAWAGDEGQTDDSIDQLGFTKNYLTFPTSDIDERADRFFRKLLEKFGYDRAAADEIMRIASLGLVDARDDIDEQLCYGQLATGEYISVWLIPLGYTHYSYRIDLTTYPVCDTEESGGST